MVSFLFVSILSANGGDHYITTKEAMSMTAYDAYVVFGTGGGIVICDTNMQNEKRIDYLCGLPGNRAIDVKVDSKGNLWANVYKEDFGTVLVKIENFNSPNPKITEYTCPNGSPGKITIINDSIWVTTGGGVSVFSEETWKNYSWQNFENFSGYEYPSNSTYNVVHQDGEIWATSGKGIFHLNRVSDEWEGLVLPVERVILGNDKLVLLSKDTLLVVLDTVTFRYSVIENTWKEIGQKNNFIFKLADGKILSGGFYFVNTYEKDTLVSAGNIPYKYYTDMETIPGSNKLWGTSYYGINYFDGSVWQEDLPVGQKGELPRNNIASVSIAKDGKAFIRGYSSNFILRLDPKNDTWETNTDLGIDGLTSASYKACDTDQEGNFWLLTTNEILSLSGNSWIINDQLSGNSLYTKKEGEVWVADSGQVHCYKNDEWKTITIPIDSGGQNNIHEFSKIIVVSENEMYLFANGYIYSYLVKDEDTTVNEQSISYYGDMDIDQEGKLWAVGYSGVYLLKDNGVWEFFPKELNGLDYHTAYCLEVSPKGDIYIGTSNGVYVKKKNQTTWERDKNKPISRLIRNITFDEANNLIWYSGAEGISALIYEDMTSSKNKKLNLKSKKNLLTFNGKNLSFQIDSPTKVSLSLYDTKGRLVRNLLNKAAHVGRNVVALPRNIASGNYLCVLKTGNFQQAKKIIITR